MGMRSMGRKGGSVVQRHAQDAVKSDALRPVLTNITPHLLRAMRDQSGRRAPRELLDSQGGTGSSMSCGRLEVLVVKTGPEAQSW